MISDILAQTEHNMSKTVEVSQEEFAAIRTGRAHPAMFAKINADYYGQSTPIQQLVSFQVPEARTILITPYDQGSLKAVEKAIRDSDLGVNPSNDGHSIRVVLPSLTEERRKEYTKVARSKAEEGRIAIRNARRHAVDAVKKLEKDKEIGEDEVKRTEKKLDDITKKHVDAIDDLLKRKETELLEV
jgi:ribosome recycling factor